MKNIIAMLLLAMLPCTVNAQKKQLIEAKNNIKKGVNLEATENSMRALLADSANLNNEKIWLTLFDAVKKQYEQNNEKLYLKQPSDTAKFLVHTKHMFDVLESLDTIDVMKNGSKPQYRKKHSAFLNRYRENLSAGGMYFIRKQDYQMASDFFDKYIRCASLPLFADYDYAVSDSDGITSSAYWTSYCGYKLQNAEMIDRYAELAMRDTTRKVYIMQYLAESYLLKENMAGYRRVLEEGLELYPTNTYFFPHLAVLYANEGRHDDLMRISEQVLVKEPDNLDALQTYSSALYATQQYDSCIVVSDHLLSLDENQPIAYINAGLSYYRKADPLFAITVPSKKQRAELQELCEKALPYLERYRELLPDDSDAYASPLYNIYLTLNIGDGFEEMERILYGE